MSLDKATAAKLRAINLEPVVEFAAARAQAHLAANGGDLDPIATARKRGEIAEAKYWARLADAVEAALKAPEK